LFSLQVYTLYTGLVFAVHRLFLKGEFGLTTFQNKDAFECIEKKRGNSSENPSFITGNVYFFESERCYLLRYRYVNKEMNIPEDTQLYLDSFRETN
jgi:hypothetical protein